MGAKGARGGDGAANARPRARRLRGLERLAGSALSARPLREVPQGHEISSPDARACARTNSASLGSRVARYAKMNVSAGPREETRRLIS